LVETKVILGLLYQVTPSYEKMALPVFSPAAAEKMACWPATAAGGFAHNPNRKQVKRPRRRLKMDVFIG
jgi:hypothetical protein